MTPSAVAVQVRPRARLERPDAERRLIPRQGVHRPRERSAEEAQPHERLQLVPRAARRRVGDLTIELTQLEPERSTRDGGVALQALAAALVVLRLRADHARLGARQQRRFGLGVIPLVGVASPVARHVLHEQARLDEELHSVTR